jgi:hypothetical protein
VEPYELNLAIQSVGILEMQAWMIITKIVRINVCHCVGTYVGCVIDAAARIMADNA